MRIPRALHAENRHRLCQALRHSGAASGAIIVLQGGDSFTRYDTDFDNCAFRQVEI